jgi:hypothetical protein
MMEQYTGMTYWVSVSTSADRRYEILASKIEKISFGNDCDYIQFFIPVGDDVDKPYTICLENKGKFFKQDNEEYTINCELFEKPHNSTYILYGKWDEDKKYTWWAIIEKQ